MVVAATGRSNTRVQQKRGTREQLIRAAYRVFCKRGIANTRMGDIAQAASVAHGTVFMHFASKDELIAEVIWVYSGRIARELHNLVKRGVTVRQVLEAHLHALQKYENFYIRLLSEASTLPRRARTMIVGIQSAVSVHLATAAQRQIKSGELRQIEPAWLFNTWIALVNHYLMNRRLFTPTGSVLQQRGAALVDHYMGLLAR